ncbi:hypothetical protein PAXRUDRAFT_269056 [Paxillus rubicundulus Ve08.2h10]|uniref:Uncharacterized protein n=1 Tax=Paxillus rubicundulus Ve08.2h10 TaxID=930991 RepID=A0A0D0E0K1_9AGAM|nr:hypothetical protein PAXRUDRAFT_269056 [Paxillus rubicundulus Ve08.2h10]
MEHTGTVSFIPLLVLDGWERDLPHGLHLFPLRCRVSAVLYHNRESRCVDGSFCDHLIVHIQQFVLIRACIRRCSAALFSAGNGGAGCTESPSTHTIEGLLGQGGSTHVHLVLGSGEPTRFVTALGRQPINCSSAEIVTVRPPSGMTCGIYMGCYMSCACGYLTNPDTTLHVSSTHSKRRTKSWCCASTLSIVTTGGTCASCLVVLCSTFSRFSR